MWNFRRNLGMDNIIVFQLINHILAKALEFICLTCSASEDPLTTVWSSLPDVGLYFIYSSYFGGFSSEWAWKYNLYIILWGQYFFVECSRPSAVASLLDAPMMFPCPGFWRTGSWTPWIPRGLLRVPEHVRLSPGHWRAYNLHAPSLAPWIPRGLLRVPSACPSTPRT